MGGASRGGGVPQNTAKYPPPSDIPSGDDDDVVARQLREAAMREPDPALREKFTGNADKVVNLITFYAQEVREILAELGARSLDEVIGRADLAGGAEGPLIVEEYDSTCLVPPGARASLDGYGNIIIEL